MQKTIKKTKQVLPKEVAWRAPSRTTPERTAVWYLIFVLLSAGALAFAIFYTHSIISTITFVLIILTILTLAVTSRPETSYTLSSDGIRAGRIFYPYRAIKKFWLDYRPPEVKTLNLITTAYINNKIVIQLGNQDPVMVKLYLNQYVREDLTQEESVTEALARRLKI